MTSPAASQIDIGAMAFTLAIGAAGGGLFALLGVPIAWLCGAMLATTPAALMGLRLVVAAPLRDAAFFVLGISMGAAVTPDMLAGMGRWPLSIFLLMLSVPAVIGAVQLFLSRAGGWDRREAFLAAVPGALSYTLAIAQSAGLDVRRVAIMQTLRLFLVVILVPFLFSGTEIVSPPVALADSGPGELLGMAAVGAAVGWIFTRIAFPAPYLLGGLAVSGVLHGTGVIGTAVPQWVLVPALVVVGANIGARFAGTDLALLRSALGQSLVAVAIAFIIATGSALMAARLLDLPLALTFLAFAPGGLEAATITAFALGLDPAYVAAHHVLRFLAIAIALPVLFRTLFKVAET